MSNIFADKKRIWTLIIIVIFIILISGYSLLNPQITEDKLKNDMIKVIVTRLLGSGAFIILMNYIGYGKNLKPFSKNVKSRYLPVIPFLMVVLFNLPWIGLISGNAYLTRKEPVILILFAIQNLMIGLFEEIAFRGVLFLFILENRRNSAKQIFWVTVVSSAIFGCVHLFNLIEGGGAEVILQVGYSFLIGGMCSISFLLTKNIWVSVLLHGIFDFCGKFVPTLGEGIIWDRLTVVLTAILAVLTIVHALFVMKKIKPEDAAAFYDC